MFDISPKSFKLIIEILAKYKELRQVYIYGSRAMGKSREGSDIDLAIMDSDASIQLLKDISFEFDDSNLIYTIDLCLFKNINNENLKQHIITEGKVFYQNTD